MGEQSERLLGIEGGVSGGMGLMVMELAQLLPGGLNDRPILSGCH